MKIKLHTVFINIDLLILLNTRNLHYILIKYFNRFMTNKTKHHDKKHFC